MMEVEWWSRSLTIQTGIMSFVGISIMSQTSDSPILRQQQEAVLADERNRSAVRQIATEDAGPWDTSKFVDTVIERFGLTRQQAYRGVFALTSDGFLEFRGSLNRLARS